MGRGGTSGAGRAASRAALAAIGALCLSSTLLGGGCSSPSGGRDPSGDVGAAGGRQPSYRETRSAFRDWLATCRNDGSGFCSVNTYVIGERGGLIKYGLDPQEGPMVAGNIDAAEEDPANYAKVCTEADGENREIVVESVRGTWKSYYQNISDVLNNGAELAVKPEEVRRTMAVYDAAMRSSETGETVRL